MKKIIIVLFVLSVCFFMGCYVSENDKSKNNILLLLGMNDGGGIAAPANLTAVPVASSKIVLKWDDNSVDETGFSVERSSASCTSGFSRLTSVNSNGNGYIDEGLQTSQFYCYRVFAYKDSVKSDFSNTASATTLGQTSYNLTVLKGGTGAGTVSGTGISCGNDCSQAFTSGTIVTLIAASAESSEFDCWSGCDSTNGASCTVAMNQNKTVTVKFNQAFSSAVTLTLNASSSTGNYTVSWACTGLCSSNFNVQEDTDSSFSSPINQWTTSNKSMSFTNKADGIYWYRVSLGGLGMYCEPKSITVARTNSSAVLRVVNSTHYDMINVRLNNVQKVSYPYCIGAGNSADFIFTSSGNVSYYLAVGFYDSSGARDEWFYYTGTVSVTLGATRTLTFNNPTISQLLTNFNSSGRNWIGTYYCYDCPSMVNSARFYFNSSGDWDLYDNGVKTDSGTVALVSWPNYSSVVSFRLKANSEAISIYYPFGIFYYRNGPTDWPVIEYVGQ